MKVITLLLLVILPSIVSAAKGYDIRIVVKHAFTEEPIIGIPVKVGSLSSNSMITDSLGELIYAKCMSKKVKVKIEVDDYLFYSSEIINESRKGNRTLDIFLAPQPEMIPEVFQLIRQREMDALEAEIADADYTDAEDCADNDNYFPQYEATFPGGLKFMRRFIQAYLEYPDISMQMGDQGKVYITFVIESDGSVTEVKIFRGVTTELDREAKKLIRMMPNWIPGFCNGKAVRVRCRLPITFTIG